MTEIMPVPRNLILLSYQQGGSGGEFLQAVKKPRRVCACGRKLCEAFCTAAAHELRETLLKQENALPEGRAFLHIFHACGCFLMSNRHTATA